jgi:hypothetical protein
MLRVTTAYPFNLSFSGWCFSLISHNKTNPPTPFRSSMDNPDMVNQPPHYVNQGEVECIDYIKQQLGDNFRYYLEGTAIKYLHRFKYKDKEIEDLKKHQFYIDKLIKELEKEIKASGDNFTNG